MALYSAFKDGQEVTFTNRKGITYTGTVKTWDYNMCTYERQYDVQLHDDLSTIVLGVPESALQLAL